MVHGPTIGIMVDVYLTDTVKRIRAGAKAAWGEPGASQDTDIPALVMWGNKRVLSGTGAETLAAGYVLTSEALLVTDKLQIGGDTYGILSVEPCRSFGTSHYKAWVA